MIYKIKLKGHEVVNIISSINYDIAIIKKSIDWHLDITKHCNKIQTLKLNQELAIKKDRIDRLEKILEKLYKKLN